MSNNSFNVAVVGATGAVGETMIAILEERKFPVKKLYPLASERSAGSTISFRAALVEMSTQRAASGFAPALPSRRPGISRN